jgi:hypothetical protein
MANISGTFSDPIAGRLAVTFTATFFQGVGRDSGFPSGASNMLLRGLVNGVAMPALDRLAPTSYIELDYPGGNAVWTVASDVLATTTSGVATYGFTNLKMVLKLYKK